jgi:hypothetical protein
MSADRLDVLRDKLYSQADAGVAARIDAIIAPVVERLAALDIADLSVRRADGSVVLVTSRECVASIRAALLSELRDDARKKHVEDFLRRAAAIDNPPEVPAERTIR